MKLISLRYANIDFTRNGCTIYFQDNSFVDSVPHHTPHYYVIAHRCGYQDDVLAYCREHEFVHEFLSEKLLDQPSRVLWRIAHQQTLSGSGSAFEEMGVQTFQRWLRANERPITSAVNWDELKDKALDLLGG